MVHGWTILFYPAFLAQAEKLVAAAEKERSSRPTNSLPGTNEKLAAALLHLVFDQVPRDPTRAEFRQGGTLGANRKHWFRAKFGNGRFRLFFRYRSDVRIIVFAWVNDGETLRTYGSRTDAYAVFERMLDGGNPPDDWDQLVAACRSEEAEARARGLAERSGR